ncbi:MAG: hypothetical protein RQ756_04585, partial [Flavobacteriaceae bacterium]|nr:hypothetical protein [Flavobacteriaceae bacterium]
MKTTNIVFSAVLTLIVSTTLLTAQNQLYSIHVDHVYPSSSDAYEKIAKKLADLAKENQEEKGWNILWTYDNRVVSISPIGGMEDLSAEFMPKTRAKIGNDKFSEIFQEFDKYYDTHNDYLILLAGNLSYMPDGL